MTTYSGVVCSYYLLSFCVVFIFSQAPLYGQFIETFDGKPSVEWRTITGDGDVVSELHYFDSYAEFTVNATEDERNIWWAIIQATVSDNLDLELLSDPEYELRIQTRVRSSHAPRRVNLHVNTQRTTDFHSHLMEFDIPDTVSWHTISMTTRNFDARPEDTVNGQLAMMDWGNDRYVLEVDYFSVTVVNAAKAEPDKGEQVLYPPPVPDPRNYSYSVPAEEAGIIDQQFPDTNLSSWAADTISVLTTDGTKTVILRWNLENLHGQTVPDYGMLELTPHSTLFAPDTDEPEFDQIRLAEILDGEVLWKRESVTYNSFTGNRPITSVLNNQMIIDIDVPSEMDEPLWIHIPRPVLQRMLDGTTRGIAFYPLGVVHATFYSGKNQADGIQPKLYFNLKEVNQQ